MTGDFLDRVNELGRIIDVARLYFERDLTQKEIAKKKKISQSEVSRLLKTARKEKLIHTTISAGFDLALESKLLAKFPDLDEVFVCYVTKDTSEKKTFEKDLLQILGHKGAEYLVQNVKHSNKIGLSCGRTLNTVARNLDLTSKRLDISLPALCKVYALVHPCIDEVVDPTPASIVSTAVRQLPDSIGYAYQFPSIGKPVDSQMSFKTFYREQINDLENRMADLDAYFVGIGHVNFNSTGAVARQGVGLQFNALIASLGLTEALKEMGAVGEIDFQPYNEAGEILIDYEDLKPLRENILYFPLKVLKEKVNLKNRSAVSPKVIGIGGGQIKRKAILGALNGKMITSLIIDSHTAAKLLEEN